MKAADSGQKWLSQGTNRNERSRSNGWTTRWPDRKWLSERARILQLACQDGGPTEEQTTRVKYPLPVSVKGNDTELYQSTSGSLAFDFNNDGLAHIRLLPDLIEDLKQQGVRPKDLEPLFNSAEGYIELWENSGHERSLKRRVLLNQHSSTTTAPHGRLDGSTRGGTLAQETRRVSARQISTAHLEIASFFHGLDSGGFLALQRKVSLMSTPV